MQVVRDVRVVRGPELLLYADGLRDVYAAAFAGPPWHEGAAEAAAFAARLAEDVHRPGFTAAVALHGTRAVGFATAWTTPVPFPADRSHPQAAAGLGAVRAEEWLAGTRQVDELAVLPGLHGTGLGSALLDAVTADAPEGRVWLLTSVRSTQATDFYLRRGWTRATSPAPEGNGVVVFLGPRHPARTLADRTHEPGSATAHHPAP